MLSIDAVFRSGTLGANCSLMKAYGLHRAFFFLLLAIVFVKKKKER